MVQKNTLLLFRLSKCFLILDLVKPPLVFLLCSRVKRSTYMGEKGDMMASMGDLQYYRLPDIKVFPPATLLNSKGAAVLLLITTP